MTDFSCRSITDEDARILFDLQPQEEGIVTVLILIFSSHALLIESRKDLSTNLNLKTFVLA